MKRKSKEGIARQEDPVYNHGNAGVTLNKWMGTKGGKETVNPKKEGF